MKKLLLAIFFIVSFICVDNRAEAQGKTVYLPSFEKLTAGKNLNVGMNLIYTTKGGIQVFANKVQGKEMEYILKRGDGTIISTGDQTIENGKKRTCWKCFTESNGDVNCFERPCPSIISKGKGTVTN